MLIRESVETVRFTERVTTDVNAILRHRPAEEVIWTSAGGPSVWTGRALQAESDDLEVTGLALLYPALERNVYVPGHHGYPRALDLIRVSAPKAVWAT
jgi:hypothetical protein